MEGNKINGKTVTESDLLALGYRKYYSDDLDVFYNKDICAHVGNCVRGDSNVFEVGRRPWIITSNAASAEQCITVVNSCPSGALKWLYHGQDTLITKETTMPNFTFEDQGDQIALINADTHQQAGEIAFMEAEDTLIIVHTGVNPEFRGNGLAEQLVAKVVEKARREDKKIFPICPFAQKECKAKPEYSDVLRLDV